MDQNRRPFPEAVGALQQGTRLGERNTGWFPAPVLWDAGPCAHEQVTQLKAGALSASLPLLQLSPIDSHTDPPIDPAFIPT